jgi:hypothetical protein
MCNIGTQQPAVQVEPLEDPFRATPPAEPTPTPEPAKQPDEPKVPA